MSYTGVILVGGRGTRLKNLTDKIAKPLIFIQKKPFLDYLLYYLCKFKFDKIYLICSYRSSQFFKRYHKKYILGVEIICVRENKPQGTAGSLLAVKNKIKKNFFLINGDSFFPINLDNFYNFSNKTKKIISIACSKNSIYKSNKKISNIYIKKNIIYFSKLNTNIMNGGIYFIKKEFLKKIVKNKNSLENDYLNELINKKKIIGKVYKNYFIDIGTKKNLNFAKKTLLKNFSHKAFFLDRDGVINEDRGYVYKISDFKFLKGVLKGLKLISDNKYLIVIITNQSGIGRRFYSIKNFNKLNDYLINKTLGIKSNIDDIYFCPHHPKKAFPPYKKNCVCRKPKPGLIFSAKKDWSIEIKKSFMIGDKFSDKQAAKRSKLKFFYKKNISFEKQVQKILKLKKK